MATNLRGFSDELAGLAERAAPSIVRVDGRPRLSASGIIFSNDGVVVTAHHVLEREEDIQVGLADGRVVGAKLIGRDPANDLAALRLEGEAVAAGTWAALSSLRVGHLVLALGRPGKSVFATLGVVSSLEESWRTPAGGRMSAYLQTDVVMYPGFSGGALVDAEGNFVGMNTSGILRGASLTIPADTIRQVMEMLLQHGRVRRGFLGLTAQPARLPRPMAEKLSQDIGLLLISVEPGGPADQAGLMLGDTLVGVGSLPVRHLDDLMAALGPETVGQRVRARLIRGGQERELEVTIGERK